MKKLYRKGTVHPSLSLSPSPSPSNSDNFSLSYLPAAILTLAAALSIDDREILAYLISCSSASATSTTPLDFDPSNKSHHPNNHHSPCFTCYCFTCYTSYWARWDSSLNRQLIHEIIDAFEDGLLSQRKKKKQGMSRREKRKNNNNNMNNQKGFDDGNNSGFDVSDRVNTELGRPESVVEPGGQLGNGEDETGEKQGSVRKLVSFIGERIWGSVWG